jgi:hypothetical protein
LDLAEQFLFTLALSWGGEATGNTCMNLAFYIKARCALLEAKKRACHKGDVSTIQ